MHQPLAYSLDSCESLLESVALRIRVRSKIGEIYEICVRLFQHIAVLQRFKLTVLHLQNHTT